MRVERFQGRVLLEDHKELLKVCSRSYEGNDPR